MEFFNPQNIHLYIAIFLSVLNGGVLCFSSSKFLQIIQQSGYHVSGYMSWLRGTKYKYLSRLFVLSLLSVACSLVTNSLFDVYHSQAIYSYLGLIFYFYFSGSFILNLVKEPNKTPLVKTKRITRTLTALFIVYTLTTFSLIALSTEYFKLLRFGIITLTPVLVPFVVVLVFWILYPVEKLINIYYISKAKRKLKKSKDLVRIGITGSYAKTTNKFILTTMLSKKYNCVAVLKTHRTIICKNDEIFINQHGNSALAKAGSGDVLAGIIAGLLAQKMSAFEAAKLGVYLHSRTGEIASEELSEYSVLASDLPKYLHKAIKEIT